MDPSLPLFFSILYISSFFFFRKSGLESCKLIVSSCVYFYPFLVSSRCFSPLPTTNGMRKETATLWSLSPLPPLNTLYISVEQLPLHKYGALKISFFHYLPGIVGFPFRHKLVCAPYADFLEAQRKREQAQPPFFYFPSAFLPVTNVGHTEFIGMRTSFLF